MEENLKAVRVLAPGAIGTEDGSVSRVVELSDGGGRVETWNGKEWEPGGARFSEFLTRPSASPELMGRLGIPADGLPVEEIKIDLDMSDEELRS